MGVSCSRCRTLLQAQTPGVQLRAAQLPPTLSFVSTSSSQGHASIHQSHHGLRLAPSPPLFTSDYVSDGWMQLPIPPPLAPAADASSSSALPGRAGPEVEDVGHVPAVFLASSSTRTTPALPRLVSPGPLPTCEGDGSKETWLCTLSSAPPLPPHPRCASSLRRDRAGAGILQMCGSVGILRGGR